MLTREAVAHEGIDGGFAAVYPVLRAMEEAGRIRRGYFVDGLGAAQFALAGALDRLRAAREPADPPVGGAVHLLAAADPANPYGAALPWPRRGETDRRPLQRAAGAYVVLVDGVAALYLERGGATLQTLPAADDPDVARGRGPRARRALVADGRIRELVIRKVDGEDVAGVAVPATPARGRVRRRLSRPRPARARDRHLSARGRHALPDRGRAAAVPRRPDGHARRGPAAPARSRRSQRVVGREITAVEALGKNLLIRFDNGLELRTHLRMNGSWHRYRPGERWRRPPARARLVLEVPGAVAVCFDAPVVELLEQRAEALHPSLGAPRAGPARARLRRRRGASAACATRLAPATAIGEALLDQRALAGIGNVYKSEVLWIERVSPFATVGDARRRDPRAGWSRPAGGCSSPTSTPTPRPERVTTAGDRGAPGPLYVYGRAGRPCRRCRTPIASRRQGRDLAALDLLVPGLPGESAVSEIDVRCEAAATAGACRVAVSDERGASDVRGRRPGRRPDSCRRSLPDPGFDDIERLVRETFAFLLEREPRRRSWPRFDLAVVERYFPEYPAEIRRRLSR